MPSAEDYRREITLQVEAYSRGNFDSYFKYLSDASPILESVFKKQVIRFTQPRALNDPLEFSPIMRFNNPADRYKYYELNGISLPSIESYYRVQIIESQVNLYGILSLTKVPNSFDMWSHYANGHRGFILEFKHELWNYPCMKSIAGDVYNVEKIEYVQDYAINLDQLVNKDKEIPRDILHKELFFKKTSRWQYEHEYRLVRPLTDCPTYKPPNSRISYTDTNVYLFHFDWDCISAVILGANMVPENKKMIAKICEEHNISLQQAHIIRDVDDAFGKPCAVYLISYDRFNEKDVILNAKPQLFCTDTISLGNKSTATITRLSDLPYYKGDDIEIVDEMWAGMKSDQGIN